MADVARAVAGNEELSSMLANTNVPATQRSQIIEQVLDGKVLDTVRALVSMIVGTGRGGELVAIVDAFVERSAASQGRKVATVRSAVALTEDQQARLAAALAKTAGSEVDLQVVIDPAVVGGAITTIGDTVIDGSLRTRLTQMREAL
ncbi:MAG: ATP synthase F1 subunit delta [Acidimicrobiales bacterium]